MVKHKYAILILAAGRSARLGRPKQLVRWNDTTLLEHTIEKALNLEDSNVYVVLGGNQAKILEDINFNVDVIVNPKWTEGMGSSIAYGVKQISNKNYEAIILSVCDQPYISTKIFSSLIDKYKTSEKSIVVSEYGESSGPPTLFDNQYFQKLTLLKGDNGAKEIVKHNYSEVSSIQFEKGSIDIDSEEDLENLSGE